MSTGEIMARVHEFLDTHAHLYDTDMDEIDISLVGVTIYT